MYDYHSLTFWFMTTPKPTTDRFSERLTLRVVGDFYYSQLYTAYAGYRGLDNNRGTYGRVN